MKISTQTAGLLLGSACTLLPAVEIPHTFSEGTPAYAEEVNDNFTAVKTAVNENGTALVAQASRLTTLESSGGSGGGQVVDPGDSNWRGVSLPVTYVKKIKPLEQR